jgi:hypothetical protein
LKSLLGACATRRHARACAALSPADPLTYASRGPGVNRRTFSRGFAGFDAEPWYTPYGETCSIGGGGTNPRMTFGTGLFAPRGRDIIA